MKFVERTRRQAPAVIIVALIDILIVLLIFLIVSTTFKGQPSVKITLPESKQPGTNLSDQFAVVVEIDREAPYFRLDAQSVSLEQLQQELLGRKDQNPQASIAILADAHAPFEQVIQVMDAARAAGLTNFSAYVKTARVR